MNINNQINALAQSLLVADPNDSSQLDNLKNDLEDLAAAIRETGRDDLCEPIDRALDVIRTHPEDPEVQSPQETLEGIGDAITDLQRALEDKHLPQPQDEEGGESSAEDNGGEDDFQAGLPPAVDQEILREFLDNRSDSLLRIEELALDLENTAADEAPPEPEELRRLLHTLKGEAGMLGLDPVQKLCHRLESLFESDGPADQFADILLDAKDWLNAAFEDYRDEKPPQNPVEPLLNRISVTVDRPHNADTETPPPPPEPDAEETDQAEDDGDWTDPAPRSNDSEVTVDQRQTPDVLTEDPEMVMEFVDESLEHLQTADTQILELENNPQDADSLNAVFRAFHTIKGLAGFFELDHIQELSHKAENLLDSARDGELVLQGAVADCAFDSVDLLKNLVGDVRQTIESGEPLPHRDGVNDLLVQIRNILNGDIPPETDSATDVSPDKKLGEILVETGAISQEELDEALAAQRQDDPERPRLGEILVKSAKTSSLKVRKAAAAQLEDGRHERIGELLVEEGEITREDIAEALREQEKPREGKKLGQKLVEEDKASAKDVASALRQQKKARGESKTSTSKPAGSSSGNKVRESIRVDADRLDHLIETIGEMVIAQSMVQQSLERMTSQHSTGVQRKLDRLDKMTRELQEVGMSLRMVPIRATFQKMARLVRDLSRKSGKKVNFTMSGEHTELDKSLVDQIGDPLVHLIRNAVDHGIETPEERMTSGKPETGRVALRAFHEGGNIFIEVEDDGGGLNRSAILNKARERGVIQDGEELSDEEVYNLIFRPGFSTNEQVTDISGRGVGMDVVKRNIEAMRGQVEVRSEPGEGSTFSIRLPLTLAIIDGMVIRVGDERYVLPTLSIEQSVRPTGEDISSVLEKGRMLEFQGHEIPMYHLGNLFGIDEAEEECTEALVVVVECDDREVGLVVDELLGQQQIVIKSLGGGLQQQPGLSGGAIMPDGKVALILDIAGLVMLAETTVSEATNAGSHRPALAAAGS